jgi:phosphate starvation-inducible protein PhoH
MSKQTREPTNDRGPRRSVKIALQFDRTDILAKVFGEFDQYLIAIENSLGIYIAARGGALTIEGDPIAAAQARDTLLALYARAEQGHVILMTRLACRCARRRKATGCLASPMRQWKFAPAAR